MIMYHVSVRVSAEENLEAASRIDEIGILTAAIYGKTRITALWVISECM
jgi:hypothetical protein